MDDLVRQDYDVIVTSNQMIAMRDGVRLACDIYRPAIGKQPIASPLPVLLERTPYGKTGTNPGERTAAVPTPVSKAYSAAKLAASGYVAIVQDCRGCFDSEGEFTKYTREADDGSDTLAWILSQVWCDGQVGTYGLSYGAHVQSATAGQGPLGLKAMIMESGAFSSAYHSGIRQGGAFELKQATWAYRQALLSRKTLADPQRKAALEKEDIRTWFSRLPWAPGKSPVSAAPEYETYLFEQWRNGLFNDYWRQPGLFARGTYAQFSDAPILLMTGWYDPYARSAIENFKGLRANKQGPVHLILGPWTHGQRSVTFAGDIDLGEGALFENLYGKDFFAFRRDWFDAWLRSAPNPLDARVQVFLMGRNDGIARRNGEGRLVHGGQWLKSDTWPLVGVQDKAFYLHASGLLDMTRPAHNLASRSFSHDPHNPVPTIGGAVTSGQPVMEAGGFDQRETLDTLPAGIPGRALAERDDVLIFETLPLKAPLEVIGEISADLWVSSSCVDTDFVIKLVDYYPPSQDYPDGYALNLAHGILRLRYRAGFEAEMRLTPGERYLINIKGFPTANRFAPGHRIRLEISSSHFPMFDVNPNSGEAEGYALFPIVAVNTVHTDVDHPSCVWLPIHEARLED